MREGAFSTLPSVLSGPVPIIHECTSSFSDIVHLAPIIHCCETVRIPTYLSVMLYCCWNNGCILKVSFITNLLIKQELLFFNFHGYIFITHTQYCGYKSLKLDVLQCIAIKQIHFMQYIIIFNFHSNIFHFVPTLHNTEKYLQRYKKFLEIFCVLFNLAILHVFSWKQIQKWESLL